MKDAFENKEDNVRDSSLVSNPTAHKTLVVVVVVVVAAAVVVVVVVLGGDGGYLFSVLCFELMFISFFLCFSLYFSDSFFFK
jgi:hypothetical protein